MSVLLAIAVLATLVLIHELGHFLAARLQGIHVNRFSIGFGPALWRYQGERTEYAVRVIPLGGYVGFPDNDEDSDIPDDDPDLLKNRPIADRAIVISAGVVANLAFAYLALAVMALSVGVGMVDRPGVQIAGLLGDDSPAAIAGLQTGDIVRRANNITFGTNLSTLEEFQQAIARHANQPVRLLVERGDRQLELVVTPQGEPGRGRIGVRLGFTGQPHRRRASNPIAALRLAGREFEHLLKATATGLYHLVANFQTTAPQLSGPVAIVAMGSELARSDAASLFDFMAIVSINLAIINILPLPALDGGQLFFLAIEALRGGTPLPLRWQENVMQGGLVLLLGLGVFMIFKDSLDLLGRGMPL